jgi:protein-S-isoprenylcysteine O-methyltransferase Ste14
MNTWMKFVKGFRIATTRLVVSLLVVPLVFGTHAIHKKGLLDELFELSAIIFISIGTYGRLWCSLYIAGYKRNCLITMGPYSMVRNPLYFFSFIGGLGVALSTETFSYVFLFTLLFGAYYPSVIRDEEQDLHALYGEAFEAYCRQVPSFWPRISLLREPDYYCFNTRLYRRNILESMCFFLAHAVLEIIEHCHDKGWLPTLFLVY